MTSVVGLLLLAQGASSFASVQTLQLPAPWKPTSATVADLDGDGGRDLVVAASQRGKPFSREVQLWRSTPNAASFTLSERFSLTPDVVGWAVGDVREGGGDEIVLFTATGVFSWRPQGPADARLERVATLEFLWQLPDPAEAFLFEDLVRDLDGDGLADLIAPGPGSFTLLAQRRPRGEDGAFGVTSNVTVPEEFDEGGVWVSASPSEGAAVRGRRRAGELSARIDAVDESEEAQPAVLVQVNENVPTPQWIDWDADGDLDLLAQGARRLHVWLQGERGVFPPRPSTSLPLPVEADRSRRLDASYSAHAVDLDGDRRADCAIFAGDKRSDSVRTQCLLFTQKGVKDGPPPFGSAGRPSDLLVFAGFVSSPSFEDLDGDGLPELALRVVRPDLIDQLRSATSESIDADVYVYRNTGGRFSKQPDLAWRHPIPIKRFQLTARFCGDLTGDRISELLLRDKPEELRVMMVRAAPRGGAWTVIDKPLWRIDVDPGADVKLVEGRRGAKPELLVIEPNQVLDVRFP